MAVCFYKIKRVSFTFRMKFSLNQEKIIAFTLWEESVFYTYWSVSWETLVYMRVMLGKLKHPVQWKSMVITESLLNYHHIYLWIVYFPGDSTLNINPSAQIIMHSMCNTTIYWYRYKFDKMESIFTCCFNWISNILWNYTTPFYVY